MYTRGSFFIEAWPPSGCAFLATSRVLFHLPHQLCVRAAHADPPKGPQRRASSDQTPCQRGSLCRSFHQLPRVQRTRISSHYELRGSLLPVESLRAFL